MVTVQWHDGFKKELAKLEEPLQARILEEVEATVDAINNQRPSPKVRPLGKNHQTLKGVFEIKWKDHRNSVRIYYFLDKSVLWLLHVDESKRRTQLTDGTVEKIAQRKAGCVTN